MALIEASFTREIINRQDTFVIVVSILYFHVLAMATVWKVKNLVSRSCTLIPRVQGLEGDLKGATSIAKNKIKKWNKSEASNMKYLRLYQFDYIFGLGQDGDIYLVYKSSRICTCRILCWSLEMFLPISFPVWSAGCNHVENNVLRDTLNTIDEMGDCLEKRFVIISLTMMFFRKTVSRNGVRE